MTITWITEDWWYPPLPVSGTVTFAEYDPDLNFTEASFSVDTTVWCLHAFSGTKPGPHDPFFDLVESKLEANSPNGLNYTVEATTTKDPASPTSATSDRLIGVRYGTPDGYQMQWRFGGGSFGFDLGPELFGWPPDANSDADADLVENGSPYSNFGRWTPTVRNEWDGATRKPPPRSIRRVARSDDDRTRSFDLQVDASRYRREVEYRKVGATAIARNRADLSGYPALDKVASGEMNNALNEHHERGISFDEWLVVHDNGDNPLRPYRSGTEPVWEYASLVEADDSGNLWSMTDRNPERYSVEVEYEIRQSEYPQ